MSELTMEQKKDLVISKRLEVRISELECEQAIFCLRAILATRKISESDMLATLNFMESIHHLPQPSRDE